MTQFIADATELDVLPIHSTVALEGDRQPIKHLLIGSPPALRHTIHRLHNLRYSEAGLWSSLLPIVDVNATDAAAPRRIILTADPGDAMSILVRYLKLN